jgi:hypothetical protein
MQGRVLGLCGLMTVALGVGPAQAQGPDGGKPAVYTYVAEWAVPRDQWRDYSKVNADERDTLNKLVADGTLIGYGEFAVLLHQEGQPTHGSWFTATSRAGLLKTLEAMYKLPQVTFPVLTASKHWDFLMVSRMHGEKSGKFQDGYLVGGGFDVKPGQGKAFNDLMKTNFRPVFEKLLAEGTVTSYSVDTEEFHSETPGRVTFVYTVADAAGVDKAEKALEATLMSDPAVESAFRAAVDWKGHRDFLARVGNMVNK